MAVSRALADLGPLRVPSFRRLWIGQGLSSVGSQMTLIAVMFQVWQMTGSTVWTGAVGMAQAIPVVSLGLFAGTLADRTDRRRLYLVAVTGTAACSVLLAAQGLAGWLPPSGVLALVGLQSCFVAAGAPAARTFVRSLLPDRQVAAGLALNRITMQAALLGGPALGGLVIGWLGVGGCYLIDAISFAAALSGALGLPPLRPAADRRVLARDVLAGLSFLARDPGVRGALLTDLAATALSFPVSLFPLINAERFGDNPRTLGLFLSAIAVGGVGASAFSGTFTRGRRPGAVMLAGSAAWGAAVAMFGLAPNAWLGLSFLVVAGAADTLSVVSRSTIIQMATPGELLGRVSAAEQIVGQAGPEVGNLRGGLLASFTSAGVALVGGGLACLAVVGLIAATTPKLRASPAQAQAR